jgi:hypothetical protein
LVCRCKQNKQDHGFLCECWMGYRAAWWLSFYWSCLCKYSSCWYELLFTKRLAVEGNCDRGQKKKLELKQTNQKEEENIRGMQQLQFICAIGLLSAVMQRLHFGGWVGGRSRSGDGWAMTVVLFVLKTRTLEARVNVRKRPKREQKTNKPAIHSFQRHDI